MKFKVNYLPYRSNGKVLHNLIEKSYEIWMGREFSNEEEGVVGFTGVSTKDNSVKRFRFDCIVSMERVEEVGA